MEEVQELAKKRGEAALTKSIAGLYLKKGLTIQGMLKTEELTIGSARAGPSPSLTSDQVAKLKGSPTDLATAKEALSSFRSLGDRSGEASSLSMIANACVARGDAAGATRASFEALAVLRALGTQSAEIPALQVVITANLLKKDFEEVVRAGKELVKVSEEAGDKKSKAAALATISAACVANDDIPQGLRTAQEALALYKELGDAGGQAAVWSTVCDANYLSGKPVAASKAAKEALALVKGTKKSEAVASLMVGTLEAAQDAVKLFKELGDKSGEGSALVATAAECFKSEKKDEAIKSSKDAIAIFKESSSKSGEALATSVLALAYMAKEDGQEATATAREALSIFRDLGDGAGENYAMNLLTTAKTVGMKATGNDLVVDSGVACTEVNEMASQESLEAIVEALLPATDVGCIVVYLDGSPVQGLVTYANNIGSFLMGLRSVGLPIIAACSGKIAGPSWGIVLAADYVIAATSTTFMLPVWGPPETFGDLMSHNVATVLCMSHGPSQALDMLEKGVVHQCQKGKEDTRRVATEMAKRVAARPSVAQSQTMHLMSNAMEKYAMAVAKGGIRA